jgi:hypothetical protein
MMLYPAVLTALLFGSPAQQQRGPLRGEIRARRTVGLGTTLTTPFGSQIFGFDIDQHGSDGIFDETLDGRSSISTFDQTTGQITKVVKSESNEGGAHELVTFGIVGNDVGLIDDEREITQKPYIRDDLYYLMDPVSGNAITGRWNLPKPKNAVLWVMAHNQLSDTQVAITLHLGDKNTRSRMYVWNSATGQFLHEFAQGGIALTEDTVRNRAVIGGSTGDGNPTITLLNLNTGKKFTFFGLNNGPAGGTNGIALDAATNIACTVTEENAQVEFYTLKNGVGKAAQLPGTSNGSELNSAQAVVADPVNHLFLVAQPISSVTPSGSTIYVYNENTQLTETINGFDFTTLDRPIEFPVYMAINPAKRLGWVQGAGTNSLQQFFY